MNPAVWVARHGQLKLGDVPAMLTPPTIYLIYVMIRGLLTRLYPYAILDAQDLGAVTVGLNILGVLIGLTALCALAIGVDRLLARARS